MTDLSDEEYLIQKFFELFDNRSDQPTKPFLITTTEEQILNPLKIGNFNHPKESKVKFDPESEQKNEQEIALMKENYQIITELISRLNTSENMPDLNTHLNKDLRKLGSMLGQRLPLPVMTAIMVEIMRSVKELDQECDLLNTKLEIIEKEEQYLRKSFQEWTDSSFNQDLDASPMLNYLEVYQKKIISLTSEFKEKDKLRLKLKKYCQIAENYERLCSICRENPKDQALLCGHIYCLQCITKLKTFGSTSGSYFSCPDCRAKSIKTIKVYL